MNIQLLAIETATDACSVALLTGKRLIHRYEISPQQHAQLILPMIDSVIAEAKISLESINVLSFGRGPGSFTGLRIAASIIQGLGVGLQKPIVPISTLRALAQKTFREQGATHVFSSLDARMDERYWALFVLDKNGVMQLFSEERVESENKIILPEGKWVAAVGFPDAQDVAMLAGVEYQLGNSVSPKDAIPIYIRDNVVR